MTISNPNTPDKDNHPNSFRVEILTLLIKFHGVSIAFLALDNYKNTAVGFLDTPMEYLAVNSDNFKSLVLVDCNTGVCNLTLSSQSDDVGYHVCLSDVKAYFQCKSGDKVLVDLEQLLDYK